MSGRNFIFTDADLDGIGCMMVAKWCKGEKTPFITTTVTNFREDLLRWLQKNKITNFDNIYVLDIDVSEHADLLDHKNVVIIDHHECKYDVNYKNAKVICTPSCTSATKLTFQHFISVNPELKQQFTKQQIKFITLVDDYDSYTLKFPETVGLNIVLWSLTGDRVGKFYELFKDGFKQFNNEHRNMITIAQKKINDVLTSDNIFDARLKLGDNIYHVMSIFCDHNINEVAFEALKRFNVDICIIVNLRTKSVSFRKSPGCGVNLSKLAEICDGGGHQSAAGGKLTDKFLKLSTTFKKYETK